MRSILKTAAATILALIPLAPSSDDGLIAASLVAVVIGDLLSSTLLTLVVIPVIDNLVVELCRGGAGGGDLLTPLVLKLSERRLGPDQDALAVGHNTFGCSAGRAYYGW